MKCLHAWKEAFEKRIASNDVVFIGRLSKALFGHVHGSIHGKKTDCNWHVRRRPKCVRHLNPRSGPLIDSDCRIEKVLKKSKEKEKEHVATSY